MSFQSTQLNHQFPKMESSTSDIDSFDFVDCSEVTVKEESPEVCLPNETEITSSSTLNQLLGSSNGSQKKTCAMQCRYTGCTRTKRSFPRLHFFKFPTHRPEICKQWITNCGDESLNSLPYSTLGSRKVCEKHFTCDSFTNKLKNSLNKDAVPTLHDCGYDEVYSQSDSACSQNNNLSEDSEMLVNESLLEPKVEIVEENDEDKNVDEERNEDSGVSFSSSEAHLKPSTSGVSPTDLDTTPDPTELVCVKMEQQSESEEDGEVVSVSWANAVTKPLDESKQALEVASDKEGCEKGHTCRLCLYGSLDSYVQARGKYESKCKRKRKTRPTCVSCKREFSSQTQLREHVMTEHGFKCEYCKLWFSTDVDLQTVTEEAKRRSSVCATCIKHIPQSSIVNVCHVRKEVLESESELLEDEHAEHIVCHVCERVLRSQAKLEDHFKAVHYRHYLCDICKRRSFSRKKELNKHVKGVHLKKIKFS